MKQERLFKSIELSYKALEPFRNLNRGLVEDYAGSGYGAPKSRQEILVNLMNQAVVAYTMALVANRPRVLLSSARLGVQPFTRHYQEGINNLIKEICLEATLRQGVLDAFFSVGIVKCHRADSVLVRFEDDLDMDPGSPAASNISIDNWVHDGSAKKWSQMKYAGDQYRVPFSYLEDEIFDQAAVRDLAPSTKYSTDSERLENVSKGYTTDADDLEPMVDLADIWIPAERKIFTFAVSNPQSFQLKGKVLASMPDGSADYGPYKKLGFNDVPENIMPTSPASHLAGLARLANSLIRKQAKQAHRQRDVHTYTPSSEPDARRLRVAGDGEWVKVNSVDDVGLIKMGGVDQGNAAFLSGVMQMFDRMAGNLTAMLGLGAQSGTLGQEELIHGAVSNTEAQMQLRVVEWAESIVRELGYMLWNDKAKVIPGNFQMPGAEGYFAEATWTPDYREGEFSDYDFDIDVYSMPYQSPQQRVQKLNELISQIYAPLQQMLMAQGGSFNLQRLASIHAELLNLPQLNDVIQFTNLAPDQAGEGGMPASTSREYVRRSVSTGGTPQNRNQQEQQAWLAAANASQQPAVQVGSN